MKTVNGLNYLTKSEAMTKFPQIKNKSSLSYYKDQKKVRTVVDNQNPWGASLFCEKDLENYLSSLKPRKRYSKKKAPVMSLPIETPLALAEPAIRPTPMNGMAVVMFVPVATLQDAVNSFFGGNR